MKFRTFIYIAIIAGLFFMITGCMGLEIAGLICDNASESGSCINSVTQR